MFCIIFYGDFGNNINVIGEVDDLGVDLISICYW